MKLYLIGLPGSGKSFLGKQLADELNLPFIDLDEVIERGAGISVSKIFSDQGEEHFRKLEAQMLRRQSETPEFVMACGGGTPCFHNNVQFMNETGQCIFLNVPVTEIVTRLNATERNSRPLLADTENALLEEKLTQLFEQRKPFYEQAAVTINKPTLEELKQALKK